MKHLKAKVAIAAVLAANVMFVPAAIAHQAAKTESPAKHSALEVRTFSYATRDGQKLNLDRLVDKSVKVVGKRPVIIFSFGGGWEGGTRSDPGIRSSLGHLAALGYTVIAIDYRLGIKIAKERKEFRPDNGVEMYLRAIAWGVEDIFDSTSFVLNHADEWNIDRDQIVLMGGSSGATDSLVAEYNVANETELARTHLPEGFRYAGIISMAGAFWLKPGTPLAFKKKPAPILFFHGAKDQLVTYDEYQGTFSGYGPVAYFRKFAGPDYPKWFVDYPQGDHIIAGMPLVDELNTIETFLNRMVRGKMQLSIHTVEEGAIPKIFANAKRLSQ